MVKMVFDVYSNFIHADGFDPEIDLYGQVNRQDLANASHRYKRK